jgi:hypothetical protein
MPGYFVTDSVRKELSIGYIWADTTKRIGLRTHHVRLIFIDVVIAESNELGPFLEHGNVFQTILEMSNNF